MKQEDFLKLVDNELLTEVGMVCDYINNPEKLEEVSIEEFVQAGFLSQPATSNDIVENGVDALDQPIILTQKSLEEYLHSKSYVKLSNDIKLDSTIVFNGDCILDLNGYKIEAGLFTESNGEILEGNSDSWGIWVKGGHLTIKGNGSIVAKDANYSMAVWCIDGQVDIKGGKYYNGGDGCDLIYASNKGQVNIYDGYFESTLNTKTNPGTANKRSALNIKDKDNKTASIKVCGGEFMEFDPADNLSEGKNTNFLMEGYKSVKQGLIYVVKPS